MSLSTNLWLNLRILIGKLAITFLFMEIHLLGLVAYQLNYATRTAKLSAWRALYCATMCFVVMLIYCWTELSLLTDRNLEYFYSGVAMYVLIITGVLSVALIFFFYAFQLIYRKRLAAYHNALREDYNSFGLFYGNRIKFDSSDRNHPENIREIDFVYMPLFWKWIIHLSIIATHVLISLFIDMDFPGNSFVGIFVHLLLPYILQSCTSSYLFLATKKVGFLYKEMAKKLKEIGGVAVTLAKSKQASQFERMTVFCTLSDQVDSMAISFRKVTQMGMNLSDYYGTHMIFILGYSVFVSLVMLFFQYMGLAHHVRGLFSYDYRVAVTTIGFLILNFVEIFITINAVEDAELRCRRVLKEIHVMNYWQRSFDVRLKQSLETFSHMATHQQFDISVLKMRKLNFALLISVADAVISYFVILIQFDLANTRTTAFEIQTVF